MKKTKLTTCSASTKNGSLRPKSTKDKGFLVGNPWFKKRKKRRKKNSQLALLQQQNENL